MAISWELYLGKVKEMVRYFFFICFCMLLAFHKLDIFCEDVCTGNACKVCLDFCNSEKTNIKHANVFLMPYTYSSKEQSNDDIDLFYQIGRNLFVLIVLLRAFNAALLTIFNFRLALEFGDIIS